jgi:hypothetical protein
MLNLGILYFKSDRGLTVPDVLNPSFVAENPQSLGDRLVDAVGSNFNRMFNFLKIETGDFAVFNATTTIYHIRFFFARVAEKIRSAANP